MAPESKRPDIKRITGRYLDAWEEFGDDRFTCEELETELLRKRDPEDVPSAKSIYQDLYRVASLGLVEWYGENQYRVAIPPHADDRQWTTLIEAQIGWMRDRIGEALATRDDDEEPEEDERTDPEVLEHDGRRYMSAFVGPRSDLESQARYYQAALSPAKHDGVVLRSYQRVANSTKKLAERICDEKEMDDTDCVYRFELSDEEMVEVGDDLEYHVFLSETRLL
ncbi:hypothetical protein [Haloplanus halophilus]|uniref:hypothetical protein n=1 Tax=Haloplanus halophilus TaxID=2949993 RepID=UPI00203ABF30|nr:hypothetical protein [Haloplanus sp. GDY1]